MIVDDVQVGCCRTGTFFSFERAGIHPDLVILSKSIGASMPLTLLLIKPNDDIFGPAEHNGTFRGNQLAFVAGKAGLDFLLENNLEAEVQRKSKLVENFIINEILPLDSRLHYRGIGLMWGVDCDKLGGGVFSRAVMQACFRRKLILERAGRDDSVVKMMPALTISDELLMEGLNILKEAFVEVLEANQ
jgi:diaminobutyrate-2-oxoglutarate transaminase